MAVTRTSITVEMRCDAKAAIAWINRVRRRLQLDAFWAQTYGFGGEG